MVSCGQQMNAVTGSGGLGVGQPPQPWQSNDDTGQERQQQNEHPNLPPLHISGLPFGIHGPPRGPPGPPRGHGPNMGPGPMGDFIPLRPILRPPFFIREIYKNGFLKRLPYNEKRSSALAKLMRSDRFWVVFSIHDDVHPFLELWNEPTEVASRPPQYIFPLAACQHISPSIIPADSEWSFVINFDTVAIRFSCNSREVMDDWVEVLRNKLGEMGILNPKGNLYSRTPLGLPVTKPVIRDPTSPLPQPPEAVPTATVPPSAEVAPSDKTADKPLVVALPHRKSEDVAKTKTSHIESSAGPNHPFTTSIYLNNTPPSTPQSSKNSSQPPQAGRKTSLPVGLPTKTKVTAAKSTSFMQSLSETKSGPGLITKSQENVAISSGNPSSSSSTGATSSVYLNQSSPTRHVTVIPINSIAKDREELAPSSPSKSNLDLSAMAKSLAEIKEDENQQNSVENHTYGAIFDFEEKTLPKLHAESGKEKKTEEGFSPRKQEHVSPSRRGRERTKSLTQGKVEEPPPLPHRPVLRRLSERRQENPDVKINIHQRIRRKSRRSSSLGPLLDVHENHIGASTHSLESVDSNPRQAVPKSDRSLGAIPRRPLPVTPRYLPPGEPYENPPSPTHPLLGSPPRNMADLPPGIRPPPYHPLASLNHSSSAPSFPPMIPLPGLTCQLSIPPGMSLPPSGPSDERGVSQLQRSMKEQQVMRLRQEVAHPAGVRLQLRKKDCLHSLALVDLFGCVWVAGWKQREYPVLFNAFHIGDQILSVSGVLIRSTSEFSKLVKSKTNELHVEIIIRRVPFAQVFHLKRDIEGQSLGILTNSTSAEVKEIIPGSVAAQAGVNSKIRSFDGQTLVPLILTEINGRPVSLLAKDGEAYERLQATGRDISVMLQPADIVGKLKKQLKSVRGYKEYLLS